MRCRTAPNLSPPWGAAAAWQEANYSIDFHTKRSHVRLKPALQIARDLRVSLESIFPLLNDLGLKTCVRCPDACCLRASPWFDLRDLIYLHLNQLSIPLAQTINGMKETCRYISHRGCTLPRITRPWICTWYLCPAQTANVKAGNPRRRSTLSRVFVEIKASRKKLEDEFIRAII